MWKTRNAHLSGAFFLHKSTHFCLKRSKRPLYSPKWARILLSLPNFRIAGVFKKEKFLVMGSKCAGSRQHWAACCQIFPKPSFTSIFHPLDLQGMARKRFLVFLFTKGRGGKHQLWWQISAHDPTDYLLRIGRMSNTRRIGSFACFSLRKKDILHTHRRANLVFSIFKKAIPVLLGRISPWASAEKSMRMTCTAYR